MIFTHRCAVGIFQIFKLMGLLLKLPGLHCLTLRQHIHTNALIFFVIYSFIINIIPLGFVLLGWIKQTSWVSVVEIIQGIIHFFLPHFIDKTIWLTDNENNDLLQPWLYLFRAVFDLNTHWKLCNSDFILKMINVFHAWIFLSFYSYVYSSIHHLQQFTPAAKSQLEVL